MRLAPEQAVAALVQRGVPQHVAEGVVLNFQDESGLNTGIQEKAPTSGRGGFGIAQWTGPRRVALEQFAQSRGVPVDDPEMQFDFFMTENSGPEKAAWQQVLAAPDRNSAAVAFVNKWERPAAEHAASRTARYTGQGPGEGAGRFGGTGLGTPADYGDSPSESGGARFGGGGLDATSTPETAFGAPADSKSPYALPKGDQDKYSKAITAGLGGLSPKAATLGAGGNAPQLPTIAPQAQAAVPFVGGGANEQGYRDAMAMLMARLNSNSPAKPNIWG